MYCYSPHSITQFLASANLTALSRKPYYHPCKNHGFPTSPAALVIKVHYPEKVKWLLAHEHQHFWEVIPFQFYLLTSSLTEDKIKSEILSSHQLIFLKKKKKEKTSNK